MVGGLAGSEGGNAARVASKPLRRVARSPSGSPTASIGNTTSLFQ